MEPRTVAGSADDLHVHGEVVDGQTRCVHWHSPLDVVAIRFACCRRWYPCHDCHARAADHPSTTWPSTEHDEVAVLCGVCRARLTIGEYLDGADACPHCGAGFNPGCRLHRHLYFDRDDPTSGAVDGDLGR